MGLDDVKDRRGMTISDFVSLSHASTAGVVRIDLYTLADARTDMSGISVNIWDNQSSAADESVCAHPSTSYGIDGDASRSTVIGCQYQRLRASIAAVCQV